jgi:phosphoenolpyruvate carboxylase
LDNAEFTRLLLAAQADPTNANELVKAFMSIADGLQSKYKFDVPRDEAVQEVAVVCLSKIHRFDPARGKAFNYFTTVALNVLRSMYKQCQSYANLKRRLKERQMPDRDRNNSARVRK